MYNKTSDSIYVAAATAEGRLRWQRIGGATFQTVSGYNTGNAFGVPAGGVDGWGWDFIDDGGHNGSAPGGIIAYSR